MGLFSSEENTDEDVFEFKPTKKRGTRVAKKSVSRKPAAAAKMTERQKKFHELAEKEMEERAREYEALKDYKLIVERVDHDY